MSNGMIGVSSPEQGRYSLFWASLFGMERPKGTGACFARSAVISDNRNKITAEALASGADWVLYLDDDHVLQTDTLKKLLDADKDVISAHYVRRQPPFWPVIMDQELENGSFTWKELDIAERGIQSVAAVGAGCLLVKRKVLEAIPPPYWTLGQIHPSSWGDDLHWCSRVKKAGFEIHVDLENVLPHIMSGMVYPQYDENQGWVANFSSDVGKPPIARWMMPLKGDL